jgi:hypothetical protein
VAILPRLLSPQRLGLRELQLQSVPLPQALGQRQELLLLLLLVLVVVMVPRQALPQLQSRALHLLILHQQQVLGRPAGLLASAA